MMKEVLIPARDGRHDNSVLPAGPEFLWRETGPIEFYVKQGYAYVHMDVRGCGKSGGEFELLGPNEQADLCDADGDSDAAGANLSWSLRRARRSRPGHRLAQCKISLRPYPPHP